MTLSSESYKIIDSITCLICHSIYKDPVTNTSCTHTYCNSCISIIIENGYRLFPYNQKLFLKLENLAVTIDSEFSNKFLNSSSVAFISVISRPSDINCPKNTKDTLNSGHIDKYILILFNKKRNRSDELTEFSPSATYQCCKNTLIIIQSTLKDMGIKYNNKLKRHECPICSLACYKVTLNKLPTLATIISNFLTELRNKHINLSLLHNNRSSIIQDKNTYDEVIE